MTKIWECKIGEVDAEKLPKGVDGPMRQAVERAYYELTGEEPKFIFSGWGAELTEAERSVVENSETKPYLEGDGDLVEATAEQHDECSRLRADNERLRALLGIEEGQHVDIVFDGPPSHQGPRFIEVEDVQGNSISIGHWVWRPDGFWVLRLKVLGQQPEKEDDSE